MSGATTPAKKLLGIVELLRLFVKDDLVKKEDLQLVSALRPPPPWVYRSGAAALRRPYP